jgi:hypothetical protein
VQSEGKEQRQEPRRGELDQPANLAMMSANMKVLTLALMFSLPVSPIVPQPVLRQPTPQIKRSKGGRWYFAATGHAVYCYGPVMTVPRPNGDLQKVATFCRDGSAIVPLKD